MRNGVERARDRVEAMRDRIEGRCDDDNESLFDMSERPFSGTGAVGARVSFELRLNCDETELTRSLFMALTQGKLTAPERPCQIPPEARLTSVDESVKSLFAERE